MPSVAPGLLRRFAQFFSKSPAQVQALQSAKAMSNLGQHAAAATFRNQAAGLAAQRSTERFNTIAPVGMRRLLLGGLGGTYLWGKYMGAPVKPVNTMDAMLVNSGGSVRSLGMPYTGNTAIREYGKHFVPIGSGTRKPGEMAQTFDDLILDSRKKLPWLDAQLAREGKPIFISRQEDMLNTFGDRLKPSQMAAVNKGRVEAMQNAFGLSRETAIQQLPHQIYQKY